MFIRVIFFLFWFASITVSHAQTELSEQACVLELGELSSETPESLVSFNLPDHLKTPLIDLTRLRIKLTQGSDQAYLHHHYLNELKKLKEIFLAQGYTEEFFNDTRTFFFRELSQRNETLEKEIETKTSLSQNQKYFVHPLKDRTRQVIDAIVDRLQIAEEDVTIEDLKRIKILNLSIKDITKLREHDFKDLINLEQLYLSYNQLERLPENVFRGLGSLKELYLFGNKLRVLPQNVFRGLGALKRLYLYHNQLTALPQNVFWGLGSLEALDLDDNLLTSLPEKIFQGLWALEWLFFSKNPITIISDSIFSAPGLNQKLKIRLNNLRLDQRTTQMLKEKYRDRLDWIY